MCLNVVRSSSVSNVLQEDFTPPPLRSVDPRLLPLCVKDALLTIAFAVGDVLDLMEFLGQVDAVKDEDDFVPDGMSK